MLFPASSDRQAYAVLDAARFFGLVQMLEGSGLPHRTLLPATASDEDSSDCDDVAPYLVQLDKGSRFVRGLFTRMSFPSARWDTLSGIMGLAEGDIDSVAARLKHLLVTRTQDNMTTWHRFWEPAYWHGLALLTGSHWTDPWDMRMLSVLSDCFVLSPGAVHRADPQGTAPSNLAALRAPTAADVTVIRAVVTRPALAPLLRRTARDHWALQYLAALAKNPQVSDATLMRLFSVRHGSMTHRLCAASLHHPGLSATASARGLLHILQSGDDHVLQA
ncbi:MAG: DUF4123 domain-containing protein [Paracoccaceae bacterium]|nr:DUF4123 domain-containing protein [Paracoccaceae bacterium]